MTSGYTLIGEPKDALDTPVLVVDLDLMEQNIARMAAACRSHGVAWRPHTKGQKVPAIAHKLLTAGAIGITCAKLGEAEVMAAAGIRSILIANQIVGSQKIARLIGLARHAEIIVAVDSSVNAEALSEAARESGVIQRVVLEVDTGLSRAGVQPGQPCLDLARFVTSRTGLRFCGLMTWEGHTAAISDAEEKSRAVSAALSQLTESAELCRSAGLPVEIVSCGGTGNYWLSSACPGITEIQAGGGIFSDERYRTQFGVNHPCSLSVIATVTSRPNPLRIVCDAGKKAMSVEAALPRPIGVPNVRQLRFSAEHTVVELSEPTQSLHVGDHIEFAVGYEDSTVNLHDELFGIRTGKVEIVWDIAGRGRFR